MNFQAQLNPQDLEAVRQITEKDRSNLYLTSQFLVDTERYQAFLAMYAVMRVIDDSVDEVEDKAQLDAAQRHHLHQALVDWQRRIESAYAGTPDDGPLDRALAWAVSLFPVPIVHWYEFIAAMRSDVDQLRFATFDAFLHYAQGATVAPTTLYVYLLSAEREADGAYRVKDFDAAACGYQLGIFAYLAHILRDVREDALVGETGLVYLSVQDLQAHGLKDLDLRSFAEQGLGDERFAQLVDTIVARAQKYAQRGESLVDAIVPRLPGDRAFVFRLIVAYYKNLLQRTAEAGRKLFVDQRLLTTQDKLQIAQQVSQDLGYKFDPMRLLGVAQSIPEQRQSSLVHDA